MATPQRARPRRERGAHSQLFTVGLCKAREFAHRHGVGAPTADSTTRTLMMTPARSRPRCERGIRFQTFLLGLKEAVGEKKLETKLRAFQIDAFAHMPCPRQPQAVTSRSARTPSRRGPKTWLKFCAAWVAPGRRPPRARTTLRLSDPLFSIIKE